MNDRERLEAACKIIAGKISSDYSAVLNAATSNQYTRAMINRTMHNHGYRWDGSGWVQHVPEGLDKSIKRFMDQQGLPDQVEPVSQEVPFK